MSQFKLNEVISKTDEIMAMLWVETFRKVQNYNQM